ncbi:hypothetical protein [Staphylococcus saprophyticus]|uniref:hypothetical protein n=1 Tax=Staphylococcus saprophyticus TaxID=29385 RepID=UPI0034C5EA17
MNIILVTVGTLIILSALITMFTSAILEVLVDIKKKKTKLRIPTETEGVYELRYNVPNKLKRMNESFKNYKGIAKIGIFFGMACVSMPILHYIITTLPIPTK